MADLGLVNGIALSNGDVGTLGNVFRGYFTYQDIHTGDDEHRNHTHLLTAQDILENTCEATPTDGSIYLLRCASSSFVIMNLASHNNYTYLVIDNVQYPTFGWNGDITALAHSNEVLFVYSKYSSAGVADGVGRFIAFLLADYYKLGAVAFSNKYSDLTGTPNLATVATSGSYADLTTKLTAGSNISFSGTNNLTISATDTKPTNHTNVGTGTESVANNTWTDIWTISNLPAGEYIVQIAVAWQSSSTANSDNGTGYRQVEFRDTDTAAGSAGWINTCNVQATSGIRTCQQMTCPIRPSSTTTYKLSVRHNAGSTIYAIPRIRYVKIG